MPYVTCTGCSLYADFGEAPVAVVLPHVILLPDASLMMLPEGLGIPFRYPLTD